MTKPTAADPQRTAFTCYLKDVSSHPLLTAEEEVRLSLEARAGCQLARQRMIQGNLRLVIRTARQYQRSDMAMDDLVEEGNLGLMHAIEKYDPSLGYRFSTYAVWWIRQYIERGIMNQARTVRLPVHIAKRLNACLRASREMSQGSCREPGAEAIAARVQRPVNEVRELLCWHHRPASLDADPEGQSWHESLSAPDSWNPAEQHAGQDMRCMLQRRLHQLSLREQEILSRRFGLQDGQEHTLESIAAGIGVTRERVRQIQLEALAKLRVWLQQESVQADFLDTE